MLSFARNERGIRLASSAILLLPLVALVCSHSRSQILDVILIFAYCIFASVAIIGFLYERAEEEPEENDCAPQQSKEGEN